MNTPTHLKRLPKRRTIAELRELPTLAVGQADDLKLDSGDFRIWISRCTVADGEPYDHKVTVEKLIAGRWLTVDEYQAQGVRP